MTRVKTNQEIEAMRDCGHIVALALEHASQAAQPGETGIYVAGLVKKELLSLGAEPVLLGYQGFPDVICISVNDAVVHGIPSSDKFRPGDVVKFDLCARWAGMITDAARTIVIGGEGSGAIRRLLSGTAAALTAGIEAVHDGVRVGDISQAIEHELRKHKLGIVRDLVGHGVGHQVHEEPNIPNYGREGKGPRLRAGMTIAIEPMATLGSHQVYVADDEWTIRTQDNSLAAQFENTVLITDYGYEILTRLQ